jgi:hypothetical protein
MKAPQEISVEKMEMLMPLIRESLAAGQSVRFYPRGVSMLPMLRRGLDSVLLSPITGSLRKYDLPLYQRDDGKYVLHRIVGAGSVYTCMGDNQFRPETGLRQDQMIGVVTAFYRGERMISVTALPYGLYCRFWHITRPLRSFLRRAMGWLRRHIPGRMRKRG